LHAKRKAFKEQVEQVFMVRIDDENVLQNTCPSILCEQMNETNKHKEENAILQKTLKILEVNLHLYEF
jgi:hypothetical protein